MNYFSILERQATMAFGNLRSVLKIFGGSSASEKTQDELYREVLMMTLAEASRADANIHPLEIETIQQIMQRETGQDFSEADIRVASRSDSYRPANFRKYLRRPRLRHSLSLESRAFGIFSTMLGRAQREGLQLLRMSLRRAVTPKGSPRCLINGNSRVKHTTTAIAP
jgi:hypothetical protein